MIAQTFTQAPKRHPMVRLAQSIGVPLLLLAFVMWLPFSGVARAQEYGTISTSTTNLSIPMGVAFDNTGNLHISDTGNGRIIKTPFSVVAGSGITGHTLNYPNDVAFDSAGNIYIADVGSHYIHKVDSSGTFSTVAGTGTAGFSGDGGPAEFASLNSPASLAVDSAGNLYIADTNNHRIRKVDTSGTISTVHSGLNGPQDVVFDSAGNLYIADTDNLQIIKASFGVVAGNGTGGFSGDGGPATSASLGHPTGIALDSAGNLFIADSINNRVRMVDASTGIISTVAGNGTEGFSGDGGPATSASLNYLIDVAVDSAGHLYIADANNHRIRKVDLMPTPVGRWRFDEGSCGTTIVDDSSNGNHITCPYTWSSDTPSGSGYAMSFDGMDDMVAVADHSALDLNQLTLSLWVKPAQQKSDWQPLLAKADNTGLLRNYGLHVHPNSMRVHFNAQEATCSKWIGEVNSVNSMTLNSWNHVVVTFNGVEAVLYLNGNEEARHTYNNISLCQNDHPLKIGNEVSAFTGFAGSIDDVRIYSQALSTAEIQVLAPQSGGASDIVVDASQQLFLPLVVNR